MYQNELISPEKLIETITTSIFFLKHKENIENDMAAYNFWAIFCSSQQPSQIGQTAEKDGAAIPSPIFFLELQQLIEFLIEQGF